MSRSNDEALEDIPGMRDFLAHHYFATSTDLVQAVLDKDLPPLEQAVARMGER